MLWFCNKYNKQSMGTHLVGFFIVYSGEIHVAVFNHVSFDEHEQVVFCHDKESGLKAIVAIHNTNLGPAVGGCRMWNYQSDDEALTDVLRLSRGMTYKTPLPV